MNAFILVLGCFRRGEKEFYTIVKFELNNNNKKETNMWIEQMSNLTWQQLLVGLWIFLFLWFFYPGSQKSHQQTINLEIIKNETKQINLVHWYETKSQLCESEHDLFFAVGMNNRSGWKRTWKNFSLTGQSTPDLCADLIQFSIH